jgi:hypothetical protein
VRRQAWDPAADEPADWGADVLALRSRQLRGRAPEPAGATAATVGSAVALLQAAARGWLARWRQQRAGWALRYLFRRWR